VELLVRGAEKLRIPLPVNSNNLKGLRAVERMETAQDMQRLGVPVRSIGDALGLTGTASPTSASTMEEPARILLVGAGRVGLVHAVTLSRMSGATLAGLVDQSRDAIVFLQRVGVRSPGYPSVEKAVAATSADAAVIATPPVTHLPIARNCLEQGLAIMIEKPLAVREEQLADFERLRRDFPEAQIQVGYLMPLIPHVAAMLALLKKGELGRVLGFEGYTLLSFVEGPLEGRWEVKPEVSGGGALINAGGHILSMICEAFGDPDHLQSSFARLHSKDVEDSVVVDLDYGGFRGRHYVSWSIGGFPRQENQLRVRTDKGELLISGGLSTFVEENGGVAVLHSLDTDVGFNLAPDYVGAGFSAELRELRDAARSKSSASMGVDKAAAIERVLFRAYASAKDVLNFEKKESPDWVTAVPRFVGAASASREEVDRVIDLRDVDKDLTETFLLSSDLVGRWSGSQVFPEQMGGVPRGSLDTKRLNVTVPDFLKQGRLLSLGRRREVLQGLGVRGALGAFRGAAPQAARDRSATFWVGALGLLGGALSTIPSGFNGGLLLHPSLADVMLALRQYDMLERMITLCRKAHPSAQVGFHTNLAAEAADALSLISVEIDQVSVLTSPNTPGDGSVDDIRGAGSGPIRVVAEVGPAPMPVHRAAAEAPNAWAHGADAVLIGALGDEFLGPRITENREREWGSVFPGLRMPQGAPC
jgi:predicted dehydrogenase